MKISLASSAVAINWLARVAVLMALAAAVALAAMASETPRTAMARQAQAAETLVSNMSETPTDISHPIGTALHTTGYSYATGSPPAAIAPATR